MKATHLTFKCPECGCEELEAFVTVKENVPVIEICIDPECDPIDDFGFDEGDNYDVTIHNYHCIICKHILVDKKGEPLTELDEWRGIKGLSAEK